jgi:hypothetical protein
VARVLAVRGDAPHLVHVIAAIEACPSCKPWLDKSNGHGQELGKEHDLSVGRGLGRLVPAHVHATAHRVHRHRLRTGLRQRGLAGFVGFNHGMSVRNGVNPRQP